MSPADGASLHLLHGSLEDGLVPAMVAVPLAVVLPGGACLMAVEGNGAALDANASGRPMGWVAACWPSAQRQGGWAGFVVLDAVPSQGVELGAGKDRWTLGAPTRLDVSPGPLAAFARQHGLAGRGALDFLMEHLPVTQDGLARRWRRSFAEGFLAAASDADGFVELVGLPDCGGLFAQGWSTSLDAGPALLACLNGAPSLAAGVVATFPRDDILPPGQGFCIYSHDRAAEELGAASAIFVEQGGQLRRLDVVGGSAPRLRGSDATAHVAEILPRLQGESGALQAFRRVCRPRYAGCDTLSGTALPVAAALDAVFRAPDGGLLAIGWLLDPLHRVERVHIKSRGGLYAPLQDQWHRLPRPDVAQGFAADPRFARLLDDEALHGFLAYARPGDADEQADTEAYLELVLGDGSCLFRPLAVTRLEDRERVHSILAAVPPADPDIDAIVGQTLRPFLAALPPLPRRPRAGAQRPIPLGSSGPAREVSAVMPLCALPELQPVLALLAATPDADALDLFLVAARSVASGLAERLHEAFQFYGLKGALVLAPDRGGFRARVEAGVDASDGRRVLVWTPRALPRSPGWLGRLIAEAETLGGPGLLSPRLVYEDGSVHFGGALGAPEVVAADSGASPLLGYPAGWLTAAGVRPVPCGAAEAMILDRATLQGAGGFSGRLFGDALAHRDLAHRLQAAGAGTWCSGSVEFWMLEDGATRSPGPHDGILDKVDAHLVADPARGALR